MFINVRFPCKWLFVASVMAGRLASGQDWQPAAQYAGYPAMNSANNVMPTGYGTPPQSAGYGYDPYGAGQEFQPVDSSLYDELLPADRGFRYQEPSRLDLHVRQMLRGTWGRIEYLHGGMRTSDSVVLGTPINIPADPLDPLSTPYVVNDPAEQFEIFNTADNFVGLAQVPTTDSVRWKNAQGIRGSFGVPLTDLVTLEGRFWRYEDQATTLDTPRIPPLSTNGAHGTINSTFLATSLTTDGLPGSTLILYDAGFASSYTNTLKAGDVALVFNWKNPDEGWRLQPILGYRHEDYSERLSFGGAFDNRSNYLDGVGIIATQTNGISSNVRNIRDMMELGMRTEWQRGFLTLGVQERLAFGSNIARADVRTMNLREPGSVPGTIDDPDMTVDQREKTTFAPSFDLDVYARIQVNHWLSFRVGYNLLWLGGIGAADRSIRFNEVSDGLGGTVGDVGANIKYSDRTVSALTIGGEIILP